MDILKIPLMAFLKANHDVYPGKVLELRDVISGWLSYIPQTFPHYTRHTIDHSDEIVLQMSKLLFQANNPAEPVIPISATEAYIAIAAAYLHDAGMVCSDREKAEILESETWKEWVTGSGTGAERWAATEALRRGEEPQDEDARNFLADLQTRFLLAELIRRTHHKRAANILEQHQATLGRFALDNPSLLRAISNVCVAHGLRQHELEDRERYPEECDIGPDRVNVRFVAILLRLGDLLDMRYDRACPLLLNPACPLPSESLAHWSQPRRITHRLTSPEKIELAAECETQEEHRVLQDWCQWLVDEVRGARTLMASSRRHRGWAVPRAELIGSEATIRIRPSRSATYLPLEWRFELDQEVVFNLLIRDVYMSKNVFIRELLQNAFDATRCQMYLDMIRDGERPPEYPNKVSEERRRRYPVRISVVERTIQNELSGQQETRQFVVVEDQGIGMDKEIIHKYFLQVGRSFYVTAEFQRNFRFVPTSRFGVGFLSVFAVSDRVVVESYKPTSGAKDGPIRLTLTGPKNYLLTERGDRRLTGTKIEVALSEPLEQGELTELVSDWCRRVEFPILVEDQGKYTSIAAEQPADFVLEQPDIVDPGTKFVIRWFPIAGEGIEGELYVFSHTGNEGESWARRRFADKSYLARDPRATILRVPEDLACLHGIRLTNHLSGSQHNFSVRIDIRRGVRSTTLARDRFKGTSNGAPDLKHLPHVLKRIEDAISEHISTTPLARGTRAWEYLQELMEDFWLPTAFWTNVPGTIRVFSRRGHSFRSITDLNDEGAIAVAVHVDSVWYRSPVERERWVHRTLARVASSEFSIISGFDLMRMSQTCASGLFANREVSSVRFISNSVLAFMFTKCDAGGTAPDKPSGYGPRIVVAKFPESEPIGAAIPFGLPYRRLLILNSENAFARWYLRVREACTERRSILNEEMLDRLNERFYEVFEYGLHQEALALYLQAWNAMDGLPYELRAPETEIEHVRFRMQRRRRQPRGP